MNIWAWIFRDVKLPELNFTLVHEKLDRCALDIPFPL